MEMIPIMIGVSLFLGGLALVAVFWGISNHQFDDPEKANSMALFDDEPGENSKQEIPEKENSEDRE